MTTDSLPTSPPPAPSPVAPDPVPPPPPRKRRRWIGVLIGVVVLVGGLVAGLFAADALAKDFARDYVRERIIAVLGLESDAEVVVRLEGSMLLQALAGRLSAVDVSVPELVLGELAGSAEVRAEDVPFDPDAPVGVLRITFSIAEADLAPLADNLSGLELESIELEQPEIVVATSFVLFGFELPIGMGLEPSAVDGALTFTPTSVRVGDDSFSADELRDDPFLGLLAQLLLQQQSLCIDEYLPTALEVTDVDVRGARLVLEFSGDGTALGGPGLSTFGSCPP
jgi:hypothetical protein